MGIITTLVTSLAGIGSSGGVGIGSLLGAGSGLLGTISAVGQARYQAQVAANNQRIAEENARRASDQAQQQQLEADRETAAFIGAQESIQGASGLSIGGASQLRTRRSVQRLGRSDAINIRQQGNSTIQQFLQEAENYRAEAKNAKAQIPGIILGGALNMASSLVGGAQSVRNPSRYKSTVQQYKKRLSTGGAYV